MDKYNILMRITHWTMAIFILGMLAAGLYMTSLPDENPLKFEIYALHESCGVIVLFLIILRLVMRFSSRIPQPIPGISKMDTRLSQIATFVLYATVLIMPLAGYIMSVASGFEVPFFNLITLPSLIGKHMELANIALKTHIITAYVLLAFIIFHILGTLKHLCIDKINILKRMV